MDRIWQFTVGTNNLICGPSNCGKSTFVEKILETPSIFNVPIDNVHYYYGIFSKNVERLSQLYPNITLIQGMPRNLDHPDQIFNPNQNK